MFLCSTLLRSISIYWGYIQRAFDFLFDHDSTGLEDKEVRGKNLSLFQYCPIASVWSSYLSGIHYKVHAVYFSTAGNGGRHSQLYYGTMA